MSSLGNGFRRAAMALIQADRPIPARTEAETQAEIDRNYNWNLAFNLGDGAAYYFAASFISSATIVPLFVSKLTANPFFLGLVAVIAQAGWYVPQLLTANFIERLPWKKPLVVNAGFFLERLPMFLPVVAALVAIQTPSLALAIFFLGYAWHSVGAGIIAPAWQELLARCFPVTRRGRAVGLMSFVGMGMGALGALLSAWILKSYAFATNFTWVFGIAVLGHMVSWISLTLVREPPHPVRSPRQTNREFLSRLRQIVRRDHNFRRFLLARSLLAMGGMGTGFLTVSAVQRWSVPDSMVGFFTVASLLGQTLGSILFGLLADRHGHKLSLELGAASGGVSFALALVAPSALWYLMVFLLLGICSGANLVSGLLVILEFCEPQRRPTYIGKANTAVGLTAMVAPLLGAWLAGASYPWLFAASLTIHGIAFAAMRWWVREPRYAETVIV